MLAADAGGFLDIFLSPIISFLPPSPWETAGYRLKYRLYQTNQPARQPFVVQQIYAMIFSKSAGFLCSSCSTKIFTVFPFLMGWSGGAMVLGTLPVPGGGGPTNLECSIARACCACSRCGWGLFGHFCLVCHFSLSPSL